MISIHVGDFAKHQPLITEMLAFFSEELDGDEIDADEKATPDVGFYDQDGWKGKGETMYDDADFTITAEGFALHKIYYDNDCHLQRARFDKIASDHGYKIVEQGYHWSFHLYIPKETT